jgi:hypothetical protein
MQIIKGKKNHFCKPEMERMSGMCEGKPEKLYGFPVMKFNDVRLAYKNQFV